MFLCKLPYFHSVEDEKNALEGSTATFIPGVTERGLIAKDVKVEQKDVPKEEQTQETGIIVIAPTLNRNVGYIGKEFVTKTYSLFTNSGMPRGNVAFTAEQLSFRINPRNIYIVSYLCTNEEKTLKANNIELIEACPIADYARIWIDENGTVKKLPASVLFLEKFLNQNVEIETNDQRCFSGIISRVKGETVILRCKEKNVSVIVADILRVFYWGVVTAYQPNNGTGFINGQYWFHVNNFIEKDQVLRLEIGSSVKFSFEVSTKGNMCAATHISLADDLVKKGYVLKYICKYSGKGFGFIIPPELLEDRLKKNDKSGLIYFKEVDIDNPGAFKVDTNKSYYSVTYTEGENNTAYNVKFIEEYSFVAKPVPKPAPGLVPVGRHTETRAISEFAESTVALAGMEYEYGLINIFSSHYALINPQYFNRAYAPDGTYDIHQSVYFDPEKASVTPDSRLKTGKYAYLVRYVRKGTITNPTTGLEQPTIDYSYPVEVVYTFLKKQCASILVDAGTITIEYVEDVLLIFQNADHLRLCNTQVEVKAVIYGSGSSLNAQSCNYAKSK